jgi:hypothetical protein
MVRAIAVVLLACATAGCAERVANPCPGSEVPRCMTKLVCVTDDARGCQTCRCDAPAYVPLNAQQAPQNVEPAAR